MPLSASVSFLRHEEGYSGTPNFVYVFTNYTIGPIKVIPHKNPYLSHFS